MAPVGPQANVLSNAKSVVPTNEIRIRMEFSGPSHILEKAHFR